MIEWQRMSWESMRLVWIAATSVGCLAPSSRHTSSFWMQHVCMDNAAATIVQHSVRHYQLRWRLYAATRLQALVREWRPVFEVSSYCKCKSWQQHERSQFATKSRAKICNGVAATLNATTCADGRCAITNAIRYIVRAPSRTACRILIGILQNITDSSCSSSCSHGRQAMIFQNDYYIIEPVLWHRQLHRIIMESRP
jgi:hypothetical protein